MTCPYCGFEKARCICSSFPRVFECQQCNRIFSDIGLDAGLDLE